MRIATRVALVSGVALLCAVMAAPLSLVHATGTDGSDSTSGSNTNSDLDKLNELADGKITPEQLEKLKIIFGNRNKHFEERNGMKGKFNKKLGTGKMDRCQKRQAKMTKRMDNMLKRSSRQQVLFDSVSTKVQSFVTTKQLTVENYEALVADVNTKKAAVATNVEALQADKAGFSCDLGVDAQGKGGPKLAVSNYQSSLRATNKSIKEYRQSLIVLVLAVKQTPGGESILKPGAKTTTPTAPNGKATESTPAPPTTTTTPAPTTTDTNTTQGAQ